jgi:hypothetical protein
MKPGDDNIKITPSAAHKLENKDAIRALAAIAVEIRDTKAPGYADDFFIRVFHEDVEYVVLVTGEKVGIFLGAECHFPAEYWRSPRDGCWTDN